MLARRCFLTSEITWLVKVFLNVIQFNYFNVFKLSASNTYDVTKLKQVTSEEPAENLVAVLEDTEEVRKVYQEIIQNCPCLDSE